MARDQRPNYIRLPRADSPVVFGADHDFQIGRGYKLRTGNDVVIFTTGTMTPQCLLAAELLSQKNIEAEIVHLPTIKPLDKKLILKSAKKCRRAISVEEHQIAGGLGSALAELLSEQLPIPLKRLGLNDEFGQSGTPDELLDFYGLTADHIAQQIRKFVKN
jgi:transketolase